MIVSEKWIEKVEPKSLFLLWLYEKPLYSKTYGCNDFSSDHRLFQIRTVALTAKSVKTLKKTTLCGFGKPRTTRTQKALNCAPYQQ